MVQYVKSYSLFLCIVISIHFTGISSFIQLLNNRINYNNIYKVIQDEGLTHGRYASILFKSKDSNGVNDKIDDFDEEFQELLSDKPLKKKNKSASRLDDRPVLFNGINKWEILNKAIFAGIFVAGIGTGITIDSAINTNPKDLASRDAIDRNAPNPKLCATYGSSAMVLDQRVFVTFNPFNVYVTQADTKPGCVLRQSNVVNLMQKERNLISDEDFEACKNSFNTWAFIGDINNKPQVNCVYQSDDAQNEFLSNPKVGLGEDIYDKNGVAISK
eukprot:gene4383-6198_t